MDFPRKGRLELSIHYISTLSSRYTEIYEPPCLVTESRINRVEVKLAGSLGAIEMKGRSWERIDIRHYQEHLIAGAPV